MYNLAFKKVNAVLNLRLTPKGFISNLYLKFKWLHILTIFNHLFTFQNNKITLENYGLFYRKPVFRPTRN